MDGNAKTPQKQPKSDKNRPKMLKNWQKMAFFVGDWTEGILL
jgi:hypothetical protein